MIGYLKNFREVFLKERERESQKFFWEIRNAVLSRKSLCIMTPWLCFKGAKLGCLQTQLVTYCKCLVHSEMQNTLNVQYIFSCGVTAKCCAAQELQTC